MLKIARLKYEHLYGNPAENPLISVCVPTYNRASLLVERVVSSVFAQTYKNFEIIIVGDCCTDNTAELLSQIDDPKLKFINLSKRKRRYPVSVENHWFVGGAVPANKALDRAKGQWIARNDDIWAPDHLETLLRFAQKGNWELVSASYITERHGKRITVDAKEEKPRIGGVQTWLHRSYLKFMKYNPECWRKNWNRVRDTDLQDRIYRAAVRMGFLDQVVVYVLPRPGKATVGLEAYKLSEKDKLGYYKFDNKEE